MTRDGSFGRVWLDPFLAQRRLPQLNTSATKDRSCIECPARQTSHEPEPGRLLGPMGRVTNDLRLWLTSCRDFLRIVMRSTSALLQIGGYDPALGTGPRATHILLAQC